VPRRVGRARAIGRQPTNPPLTPNREPPKKNPAMRGGVRRESQTVDPTSDGGGTLVRAGDRDFLSARSRQGKLTCRKKHPAISRVFPWQAPPDPASGMTLLTRPRERRNSRPVPGYR
jgi:hypothetical protein